MKFISNHNHTDKGSNLKMLDCACKTIPLIDRAIELGYSGLSITDHSSISSHIEAIQYVKKIKEKGIDFVLGLGSEEYVVDDHIDVKENYQGGGITKFWHMIFIAKNELGYEQLRRIDSTAWGDNSFMSGKMRRTPIDKQQIQDIIGDEKGNLLCSTACLGGEMAQHVLNFLETKDPIYKEKVLTLINWMINTFGKENIAFEIQPSNQIEQIEYNKFLIKMGKAYKIPIIITNDTHYLKKEDRQTHGAFITSRDAEGRELADFYATTYLMSIDEMFDYVKDYISQKEFEEIIENSYNFSKDIEFIDMEHPTIIPERDLSQVKFEVKGIFKDWYDKYEGIRNFANSEYIQDKYLFFMIEEGFLAKKEEFNEINIARINWELNEIWKVSEQLNDRMSAYYNLVDYIVDLCWEIGFLGISRGCFTNDSLATTLNGLKTLDKVVIGDKVLSADGKFNNVLNTLKYDIKEPLVEIKYYRQGSSCEKNPSICTLDHEILIERNGQIKYEQAKNLVVTDFVLYPKAKEVIQTNVIEKRDTIKEDENYWYLPVQEIKLIEETETTVYDLTVENNHSYTINNMCVHNSVTGYYTLYLIDMHQMNPIEWNLPAYRHLNSSRVSFPKQHWGLMVNLARGCVA